MATLTHGGDTCWPFKSLLVERLLSHVGLVAGEYLSLSRYYCLLPCEPSSVFMT